MGKAHKRDKTLQNGGNSLFGKMIDHQLTYGRQVIRDYLKDIKGFSRVVDLGAGYGADLQAAREMNHGASLHAVECAPPCVKELKSSGIKVHSINIERDRLPFRSESIDVFIANQVLEHTKEIFWIMHEISRCLKPGGYVIIGVPNLACLHNRILLLMGEQPSQIKSYSAHVRGFTKPDMQRFFSEIWAGGYSLIKFRGSQFYPFPPLLAEPLARLFPTLATTIFFLWRKNENYHGEFLEYPVQNSLETPFYLGK